MHLTNEANMLATQYGQSLTPHGDFSMYHVVRRNGEVVEFNPTKIAVAITKAYIGVHGHNSMSSVGVREQVAQLTNMVILALQGRKPDGGSIHIEEIQDQVELALMRTGEQKVARAYVIYREQRATARQQAGANHHPTLQITDAHGQLQPLDLGALTATIETASEGLEGIDVQAIVDETVKNLYNGVKESDIATTMMMATRTRIEQEPNYTYVTARLLRNELVSTGLEFLGLSTDTLENDALETFLKKGIELDLLSADLLQLAAAGLCSAPESRSGFASFCFASHLPSPLNRLGAQSTCLNLVHNCPDHSARPASGFWPQLH